MKKFLFIAVIALCMAGGANAQYGLLPLKAQDTLITTGSLDTVTKVFTSTGKYGSLAIQVVGTKLSGTQAGKAYLYRCNDNANYVVSDSTTFVTGTVANTYIALFEKTNQPPWGNYKVQVRDGAGQFSTQSVIYRFYVYQR